MARIEPPIVWEDDTPSAPSPLGVLFYWGDEIEQVDANGQNFNLQGYVWWNISNNELQTMKDRVGGSFKVALEIGGVRKYIATYNGSFVGENGANAFQQDNTYYVIDNISLAGRTISGTAKVRIIITDSAGIIYYQMQEFFSINFLAPVLNNINITGSSQTTSFYRNATFNYNGLKVNANYKWPVSGSTYLVQNVTGYSVTEPDMTAKGTQTVYVSYGGKTTWYNINIVYATNFSWQNPTQKFRINHAFTRQNVLTVTYSNGNTEYASVTGTNPDMSTFGTKSISLSATSFLSKETSNYNYQIEVYPLGGIALNTTNARTTFDANETFSASGLQVTAMYGYSQQQAITELNEALSLSDVVITAPDMSEGGRKPVYVAYTLGSTTYRNSYDVLVNGISNFTPSIPNANRNVEKGMQVSTSGITGKVTLWENGVSQRIDWEGTISAQYESGITDTTGVKNIAYTVTDDLGTTLSYNSTLTVFDYESITVENFTEELNIVNTSLPVFAVGNLKITAVLSGYSEPKSEVLTYNASYLGYIPNLVKDGVYYDVGDELPEGEYQLIITTSNGKVFSTSQTVKVIEDHPAENAYLIVEATEQVRTYENAIIDRSKITVKISEMASGRTNVETENYSVKISGLNRDHFEEGDTLGNYNLIISYQDLSDATIQNKVFLKGVSSVSITNIKTNYKVGETFEVETIEGTIYYNDDTSKVIELSDISNYRTEPFTLNEAGTLTHNGHGTVSLTFKVAGYSVTQQVSVCRLYGVKVIENDNPNYLYNMHDSLSFTGRNFKLGIYFNDGEGTYGTLYKEISSDQDILNNSLSIVFKDASGSVLSSCNKNDLIPSAVRTGQNAATVNLYISYSDNVLGTANITAGGSSSYYLPITVRALRSVTLYEPSGVTVASKFYYEWNEQFSLEGYILKWVFNDGTTGQSIIDSQGRIFVDGAYQTLSSYPNHHAYITTTSSISGRAYFSFAQEEKFASFTVHCHYISDITVDWAEVEETTYYAKDLLDLSSVTAYKTIESTDSEETTYPQTEDITEDLLFKFGTQIIGDGDFFLPEQSGTYSLQATYQPTGYNEFTSSLNILVNAVALQSISVNTGSAFKPLDSYVETQNLDLTGLTVTAHYNNSALDKTYNYYDLDIKIVDEDDEEISKTQYIDLSFDGKEIFAKFENKVASIGTFEVETKALSNIEIVTQPTLIWTYGDVFRLNGLVVNAIFNSGSSELVNNNQLTVTGVDVGHEFNPTDDTFGTKTVTISYTYAGVTKTATFTITITQPTLASIVLNINDPSQPVRTQFADGDVFTDSGLVVKAIFQNGYEEVLPSNRYTSNKATVLNLDNENKIHLTGDYGFKTITITGTNPYIVGNTKTATYNVEIITSGAIVSAVKKFTGNDYEKYLVGEEFDARGVAFEVTDVDGNTWTATNFTTSIPKGNILRSAGRNIITCTYNNGSFTASFDYAIIVSIPNKASLTEVNDYAIAVGTSNGNLFTSINHEEATISLGEQEDGSYIYPLFNANLVEEENNPLHALYDTYGYNVYIGDNAEDDCIGYLDLGLTAIDGTVIRQAHVVLFDDPLNPIEGQGNIIVTFPHYVEGLADKINKAHFGTVYNNRLFVSGNKEFKNCDWHSGAVNVSQVENYKNNQNLDFTYFSDLDYCYYGLDDTAIVGYDIYSDGELIVVKEGSNNQATLYKRSYKLVNATSYDGNAVSATENYGEDAFPMFDINGHGGIGGLSNRSIVNFVGDTLILTRDGLKALTSKDEIYNNAKYTYDVSSYINPKITYEELENAHLFAYKQKLLLKTKEGVYVGYYELRNENKEYEWYFLNNIDADLFFEIDNELYFANNKGEICRFDNKLALYIDEPRVFTGTGSVLVDEVNDKVSVSKIYANDIKEGYPFHVLTTYRVGNEDTTSLMFASLGLFVNKNTRINKINQGDPYFNQTIYNGVIDADNDTIEIICYEADGSVDEIRTAEIKNWFYDGRKVYFDNFGEGQHATQLDVEYTLKKFNEDEFDNRYLVLDPSGETVDLLGVETIRMSFPVNHLSITKIINVEDTIGGGKQFQLLGEYNNILNIIHYANRDDRYSGVITKSENVKAHYITAPYTMSALAFNKTIWQWVIANDTNLASFINVGFFASRKQGDFKNISGSSALDFKDMNMNKIQFINDKLPHFYSRARTVPHVGFIRFLFENNEDSNMVLTTLQVIYTLSQFTKGDR